jgi:transcriptional regulator with XRE-family HTH domain|nr:MAG TPA: helix-turn-helix domain protein [Caudoviricetes sp.]
MAFYQQFIKLCNDTGISPSRAALNAGLSKTSVNGWKRGQTPTDKNIAKLAEVFNVPVSYFDEKEEKLPVDTDKELSSKYSDWQILAAYEKADDNVKEAILLLLKLR